MGFQEELRASKRMRMNNNHPATLVPLDNTAVQSSPRQSNGPQGRDDTIINEGNQMLEVFSNVNDHGCHPCTFLMVTNPKMKM
jgi:hypothetical protein